MNLSVNLQKVYFIYENNIAEPSQRFCIHSILLFWFFVFLRIQILPKVLSELNPWPRLKQGNTKKHLTLDLG